MGLSVFAARQGNGEVYAGAVTMESRDEVQEWLDDSGANDRVIAFLPLPTTSDTAAALEGLIQISEFGSDFDSLLTDVFKLGMEVQNNER